MIDNVQDRNEAGQEAIVFNKYTIKTLQENHMGTHTSLLRKCGTVDSKPVTILLDCGASTYEIRPGLATTVLRTQQGPLKRFDGTLASPTRSSDGSSNCADEGRTLFGHINYRK